MPKSAKRQFLVRVDGVDSYFATKTGGKKTATANKAHDGGSPRANILVGPPNVDDIVVARPWETARDLPVAKRMYPLVGSFETTVTLTPTDGDYVVTGDPIIYTGAVLMGCTSPDVDASAGDPSTLELTFAVADVA